MFGRRRTRGASCRGPSRSPSRARPAPAARPCRRRPSGSTTRTGRADRSRHGARDGRRACAGRARRRAPRRRARAAGTRRPAPFRRAPSRGAAPDETSVAARDAGDVERAAFALELDERRAESPRSPGAPVAGRSDGSEAARLRGSGAASASRTRESRERRMPSAVASRTVARVYIGLGSNLGDREATLRGALELLRPIRRSRSSPSRRFRETDPVGYLDQPRFLNAAAALETELEPRAAARAAARGRARARPHRDGPRFGPRTIDLDLLLYGDRS